MENQTAQNPTPEQALTPIQISEPKAKLPIMYLVLSFLILALLASTVFLYYKNTQLKNMLASYPNSTPPIPTTYQSPFPTTDPATDWISYANTKYGYSIKHPNNYLVGYANVRIGTFNQSNGNEDQVEFLPSESDEFNNFLQIQISDLKSYNKSLTEVIDGIYQQQKSHFQTTDISSIVKSKFNGYDDYEYTFSGQAFYTFSWNGTVKSGKYKTVIFLKDGDIYSFYLKDSDIFNQILSTFKFTN